MFTLLHAWGVEPDVASGWGTGEYPAACAAGVLAWHDGLRLAVQRAQLMASLVPGAEIVRSLHGFRRSLARTPLSAARLPLLLASRGRQLSPGERLEPAHFGQHLYRLEQPAIVLDEPNSVLLALGAAECSLRCAQARATETLDDYGAVLSALAVLYERGVALDLAAVECPYAGTKASVPGYPFQRKRCWLDPPHSVKSAEATPEPALGRSTHPLLRA